MADEDFRLDDVVNDNVQTPLSRHALNKVINNEYICDDAIDINLYRLVTQERPDLLLVSAMIWNVIVPTSWTRDRTLQNRLPTVPKYSDTWEKAIIPINVDNSHWQLAILDKATKICTFYCTLRWRLREPQLSKLKLICRLLLGGEDAQIIYAPTQSFGVQGDNYNCGPMICMLAERIFSNQNLFFTTQDAQQWRQSVWNYYAEILRARAANPGRNTDADFLEIDENLTTVPPRNVTNSQATVTGKPENKVLNQNAQINKNIKQEKLNDSFINTKKRKSDESYIYKKVPKLEFDDSVDVEAVEIEQSFDNNNSGSKNRSFAAEPNINKHNESLESAKLQTGPFDNVEEESMDIDDILLDESKTLTDKEKTDYEKEAKETFAKFCTRKKISKTNPRSRNLYNTSTQTAKDKLVENERINQFMKNKRALQGQKNTENAITKMAKEGLSIRASQALKDKNRLSEANRTIAQSESKKTERQQKNKFNMQQNRKNETDKHKNDRLQKDATNKKTTRENENEVERSQRLENDACMKDIKRTIKRIEKQEQLKKDRMERLKNPGPKKSTFLPKKGASSKNVKTFRLGIRDNICTGCGAKHYRTEKSEKDGTFTSCCQKGRITHPTGIYDFPESLRQYMTKEHPDKKKAKIFNLNTRTINSGLSCAHMYAKNVKLSAGVPCLKIQGKVLRKMPRTYLPSGSNSTFGGQHYIVDSGTATVSRINAALKLDKKLNQDLMIELDQLMRAHNIFAQSYTMLATTLDIEKNIAEATGQKSRELRLLFKGKPNASRNYDRVEAENEIALVYTPGPDGEIPRDDIIIFEKKDGNKINETLVEWDPRIEPLTYPLFFPTGTEFHYERQLRDPNNPKSRKMTLREYFAFKLQDRDEETCGFNPIIHGGKLFLQYLCDAYARVESDRLNWYKKNQKKIRVSAYKEVQERLEKEAARLGKQPGTIKILPSQFYTGPRYLRELCSDAISMVDEFGKPTALITMTVNTADADIINNLYENQQAWERPDLVNSCFYQKLQELIRVVEDEQIFGPVECSVIVIEFQKRGLPHCHGAFTLKEKWDTPEKVDSYIRAYLPPLSQEEADECGEEYDPEYLELVKTLMIHNPCGKYNPNAPCMVNGKCKRKFPQQFREETVMDDDGYTRPKRPNNGRKFTIKIKGEDVEVDNRWVVAHNPFLLKYFKSHINVEAINSITTVFYIFKYMFKGDDKAFVEMNEFMDNEIIQKLNYNEIDSYEDFRYISACEAHWRLSDYWLYNLSHSVDRLPVHLEGEHTIVTEENPTEDQLQEVAEKDSKLLAFFKLNQSYNIRVEHVKKQVEKRRAAGLPVNDKINDIPQKLLYNQIGKKFVWNRKEAKWDFRKITTKPKVCRIYNVNPKRTQCFYLRRLLMAVAGPTSFEDIRTVNGVTYASYREACVALGLVINDQLYEDTLFEAINHGTPKQLRYLFARLLAHCDIGNPLDLFDKFEEHLIKDLLKRYTAEDAKKIAFRAIVKSMLFQDKQLSDYPELEAYMAEIGFETEATIDLKKLLEEGLESYKSFNDEQKLIADTVLHRVENPAEEAACFFADGPGGCGKSYTFTAIRKILIGRGKKVMVMAWSGIAASLYPMGRTCHNAFKLDFPFERDSNSGVKPSSPFGKMLEEVDIIIWDEFPMAPKRALEVIDLKLREIMGNDIPFGGKIILCGGDFRQCCPIVEDVTTQEIINECVCCSDLWTLFHKFQLTENLRALPHENEFKKMLLDIGDGIYGENPNNIEIPKQCLSDGDIVGEIFGDVIEDYDPATVMKRAILATYNTDVDDLNDQVINLLDEETELTYFAQDVYHYGDEMLQNFGEIHENYKTKTIKGLPSFNLRLRINAIVMLVRNLSIEDGLCNGTRLVVTKLLKHNLVVKKINIDGSLSEDILIPRISLRAKHGVVEITRHQFPVKLGFCMTINKSQGQTMDKVGVVLKHECFSHGQLYVAFSRVRSIEGLKVVLAENKDTTANVVYKELLELGRL